MANPNIVNVTAIFGKVAVQAVGTAATAIVSNSVASGKIFKINALYAANVDGAANADLTVDLFRSSVAYRITHTVVVPADATLDVLSKSIYLEEGDSLRLSANAAGDIEVVCSYEEIND